MKRRTNVKPTSKAAYHTSDFSYCELVIIETLRLVGPLPRQSISLLTGLTINNVCGRVYTLKELGVLRVEKRAISPHTKKRREVVALNKSRVRKAA